MAIINTQTVIACGLSIDIYSSFDPAQVMICPYVFIEKHNIQLIYMNISFDKNNQIIIYSNPPIISPPKFFIKLNNNSFISPSNLNQNYTYYLSFSSELTCRFSLLNNETICFYYPISSDFIHIEHHYDEIKHGSLMLSETLRNRFYIIFIIIAIFVIIICSFAISIICASRFSIDHPTQLDLIIDTEMARQEAAKRPPDPLQDGAVGQQMLAEHFINKEAHGTIGDISDPFVDEARITPTYNCETRDPGMSSISDGSCFASVEIDYDDETMNVKLTDVNSPKHSKDP